MYLKQFLGIFLLTLTSIFCIGQDTANTSNDSLLKVISCGTSGANIEHPNEVASKHFGFVYIFFDSLCNPRKKEGIYGRSKYVDIYNDSIFKIVAQRYGSDWKERYVKEIKRLYEIQENVRNLLIKNKSNPNLPKTFSEDIEDRKLLIWVDETEKENIFKVNVLSWLKVVQPPWNIIYRLIVDTKKNTINVLSKKIEPLR